VVEHKCELAVENSFGTSGAYYYAAAAANADPTRRAHSDWNNRAQRTPYTDAPRGALVFYNTSVGGHVAISLGNGTVVSSSAPGGRIGTAPISYFQRPYGWAFAPW
jgi:cell wall-associated NlpC family hydrolase